jgi:uncharacterized phage-associated protein
VTYYRNGNNCWTAIGDPDTKWGRASCRAVPFTVKSEMKPYSPIAVANRFLQLSFAEKRPIDHMKLQKLVFFAHGYYLAASKLEAGDPVPLVDEYFEAWPYGPVSPRLYEEFKEFGRREITRLGFVFDSAF